MKSVPLYSVAVYLYLYSAAQNLYGIITLIIKGARVPCFPRRRWGWFRSLITNITIALLSSLPTIDC